MKRLSIVEKISNVELRELSEQKMYAGVEGNEKFKTNTWTTDFLMNIAFFSELASRFSIPKWIITAYARKNSTKWNGSRLKIPNNDD